MTTGQWINKWLDLYVTPRVRASTQNLYYGIMRRYAIPELGMIPLSKLTEFDIQAVLFGPLRQKYRTACIFRVLMMAMMKKAVKCRLIRFSPAADLELPPKTPKKKFYKPSAEDWKTLIEYPKTPFYFWRWLLLTEYVTGARLGELLALKWEDLNIQTDQNGHIKGGTLHIQHALYSGMKKDENGRPPLYRGGTKTPQGNRILPLPVDYCYEIQHYRKVQLEHRMLSPDWQENGFLFTAANGSPLPPNKVSVFFLWLRKKLGIKSTFHMLRHDMASRMKNSSQFDLKDIQNQLGHASIKITMDIYTHIDEEAQQTKVSQWLEEDISNLMTPQEKTKAKHS
ncbi:site-specific integrase [Selenomonas sp. WCT3]|uniref:site-specific integrase n=1 Tax=Selenomonas sp. WCT3 TaxID=3158785 RepID=UPI000944A93A